MEYIRKVRVQASPNRKSWKFFVIIPSEVARKLRLQKGEELYLFHEDDIVIVSRSKNMNIGNSRGLKEKNETYKQAIIVFNKLFMALLRGPKQNKKIVNNFFKQNPEAKKLIQHVINEVMASG